MAMQYEFTLKFTRHKTWRCSDVPGSSRRLAAAGVLSLRQRHGRLALQVRREGRDAAAVIDDAIVEAHRIIGLLDLHEVGPDYVGMTGLARRFGVSRQAMRKLMVSRAGRFPAPIHQVHAAVWHLAEVLEWLEAVRLYRIDIGQLETARAAQSLNLILEQRRLREVHRHTARLIDLPREIAALTG
jgi:hypothetical protein